MKLIGKYLKQYVLVVFLCIAMLVIQASCDLSLPNYMGDIVNVGIQQGGIEDGAPDTISKDGMDLLTHFMSAGDFDKFTGCYDIIDPDSSKYSQAGIDPDYDGDVYALKKLSGSGEEDVGAIYSNASYSMILFLQDMAGQGSGQTDINDENGFADMDITQIYKMLPMLETMGSPDDAMARAAKDESMMKSQVGIVLQQLFNKELGISAESVQSRYIRSAGGKMLLIALLAGVVSIIVSLISSVLSAKVGQKLRHDLFEKVQNFTSADMDNFSVASLITRSTNDIQQVQMLITMGLRMLCYAPVMGVGGVIFALRKSVSLSWIIALTVVIILGVMLIVLSLVMPKFKSLQKLTDRLNLVSRENLSGMMVIRAFGNEEYEEKRFDQANDELSKTNLFVQKAMSFIMPCMMLLMNFTNLAIIWFGGKAISNLDIQIGDMLAFMQYGMHIIMSFLIISMMFVFIPRALVSAKRISEVLDTDFSVTDKDIVQILDKPKGHIEFKNVSFRYSNAEENVLDNISFDAEPGKTTAFIGATGSGKSTLINLIPRFYDITDGSIMFDGKDIRDLSQDQLRGAIGYVPQKGLLFSGTVESNLKFGKEDATEDDMVSALETAMAKDFIYEDERELQAPVSQGGTNFSGGQRQRLSIARALTKKAPVYIFDDSFSALDFKTDAALRRALGTYTGGSTVLIVAQRVSTIMNADQIIVLDDGKIVGKGTHRQLLAECDEYREIAESQMKKEELL